MKEERESIQYQHSMYTRSVRVTVAPSRHPIRQQLRDGSNSRMGHRERRLRESIAEKR
jgi:hypothetical protein